MTDLPATARRVEITAITPQVDGGRWPVKRTAGDLVVVEADVFADGHDMLGCAVRYRAEEQTAWQEAPMSPLGNDRWRGSFALGGPGRYCYTVTGWIDHFATWAAQLRRRVLAEQDIAQELLSGAQLIAGARARAGEPDAALLHSYQLLLEEGGAAALEQALSPHLAALMARYPDRDHAAQYEKDLTITVERQRARYSTWYEMFPRSAAQEPGRHGTLRDCIALLPYVADMGFDVLYLPPIHPIGHTHRKGPNNTLVAGAEDPGSPWAIGSADGGHTAIHPHLGTLEDFRALVAAAGQHGIEVALDLAFQASPDHPYVHDHAQWFSHRPDGSIRYAENPPKRYQDIYPFDFESGEAAGLWEELRRVVVFWIAQGVRIFRVDNPHTKPFPFWQWLIADIQRQHPDALFLAEAFTRPAVMEHLAKLGFSQSYTYFTWRTTKYELTQYFSYLTSGDVAEFFRPNLWPNTPDILTEQLQIGGRSAFVTRLVLAATLGASYGIYGPPFELMEHEPREWGSEEYLDSEKYQVRHWERDRPDNLRPLIALVNRIRRDHPALQRNDTLRFHHTDNDQLLCYSKTDPQDGTSLVMVVNLDPHHTQRGWLDLAPDLLATALSRPVAPATLTGSTLAAPPESAVAAAPSALQWEPPALVEGQSYQVHDLLGGGRFLWRGSRNYVELDPQVAPAHIFRLRRRLRSEHDFEYFG